MGPLILSLYHPNRLGVEEILVGSLVLSPWIDLYPLHPWGIDPDHLNGLAMRAIFAGLLILGP